MQSDDGLLVEVVFRPTLVHRFDFLQFQQHAEAVLHQQ